jgi:hypothetical protein
MGNLSQQNEKGPEIQTIKTAMDAQLAGGAGLLNLQYLLTRRSPMFSFSHFTITKSQLFWIVATYSTQGVISHNT